MYINRGRGTKYFLFGHLPSKFVKTLFKIEII